ncbi:MAG: hypothetical protein SGJ11_18060 [Phycisphaerae bacterium]|nr:hypothetical protein [Phycisphaerae bacterium]
MRRALLRLAPRRLTSALQSPNRFRQKRLHGHVTLLFALLALGTLGTLAAPTFAQEVKAELVSFGVGDCARPGDWIGVRIAATSTSAEVKKIELVLEAANADADVVENSLILTVSGQRIERWVYIKLPPSSAAQTVVSSTVYLLRVFEVDEQGRRIDEIANSRVNGSTALSTSIPVDQLVDLILVLGDSGLGLEGYSRGGVRGMGMLPSLNSTALTVRGISPRELPDRWAGLSQYQAIIWCDPRRLPSQLEGAQAEALKEWTRRGGTLVIGVAGPNAFDAWFPAGAQPHPLSDILPSTPPQRREGVAIQDLLPILSKNQEVLNPKATFDIATFDAKSLDRGYRPFVALPSRKAPTGIALPREGTLDGTIVGIQRNLGRGQVVVLGIDVDSIGKSGLQRVGLPQADVFWNRILGRRGDVPSSEDLNVLEDAGHVNSTPPSTSALGSGETVMKLIGISTKAAVGILSAATLFGTYWLLSGPLGFTGLKHFRRERHSWVLFVVFAFLFTAIAWIGGALLGRTAPSLQHLTVIDQLAFDPAETDPNAGVPPQTAISWFSAFLPGYSPTRVRVGVGEKDSGETGDLLASWAKPPSGSGDAFPNRDRYVVPTEHQNDYAVPSRATSVDFVARWRGTIEPSWGGLIRMASDAPVRLRIDPSGPSPVLQLSGSLIHDLPGDLKHLTVILVSPYRTPLPTFRRNNPLPLPALNSEAMPLYGLLARKSSTSPWKPGVPLNLDEVFPEEFRTARIGKSMDLATEIAKLYRGPILQQNMIYGVTGEHLGEDALRRYLESLSLYSMLEPPDWIKDPNSQVESARAEREHAREIDLGPWFTRPCIIIMGFLEGHPIPIPVKIDGSTVASEGMTLYRWICPLDDPSFHDLFIPDRSIEALDADDDEAVSGDDGPTPPVPAAATSDGAALNPDELPAPGASAPAAPPTGSPKRRPSPQSP